MEFQLTEEQKLLRQTIREFADSEIDPLVEEFERKREFPRELVMRLWRELGLGGMYCSEEYGGIDLGAVSCLEADSPDTETSGNEDSVDPALGTVRIYFVDYDDGRRISYGTETARKPRLPAGGDCP